MRVATVNSQLKTALLFAILAVAAQQSAVAQVTGEDINTGFDPRAQQEVDQLQQQYKAKKTYSGWNDFNRMAQQQRWSPEKYKMMQKLAKESGVLDSADDPLNGPGAQRDNGLPVYKDEGRPDFNAASAPQPKAPGAVQGWTSSLESPQAMPMQQGAIQQPGAITQTPFKPPTEADKFKGSSLYQKGFFGGISREAMDSEIEIEKKVDLTKSPDWAKDKIQQRSFQDGQERFGEEDPNGFF